VARGGPDDRGPVTPSPDLHARPARHRLGPVTRLLHLSDTHLHAPGASTLHPEVDVRGRLSQVLDRVRAYGPFDAVVVTGDVCDDGSDVGARAVREAIGDLAPVVLAVPGNHDLPGPVREAFGTARAEVGPWLLLGVETQVEGEVAGVGDAVAPALAGIGERPAVLLMHHPLVSRSRHEWFTLGRAEAALSAVERHRAPLVVLSGHTHERFEGRLGTAYLLGAPSTYYTIRHDGGSFEFALAEFGAAVVTLDDETFEPEVDLIMLTDESVTISDRIELTVEGG
jgi:3',5'-cyclic-AMP phosphodiesterase